MALKNIFLVGLVIGAIAVEISNAQVGNFNGTDVNLVGIPVTLYCTPDGSTGVLGLATPPFKGANVLFQCGNKSTIAKATTNTFGFSYIVTSAVPVLPFFPPDSNCKLVVDTALSTCDALLPSTGSLQSGLNFAGTFTTGSLKVANFAPTGFRYNATA